jgi:hypothetical protein
MVWEQNELMAHHEHTVVVTDGTPMIPAEMKRAGLEEECMQSNCLEGAGAYL